jgi:hypothetical protein
MSDMFSKNFWGDLAEAASSQLPDKEALIRLRQEFNAIVMKIGWCAGETLDVALEKYISQHKPAPPAPEPTQGQSRRFHICADGQPADWEAHALDGYPHKDCPGCVMGHLESERSAPAPDADKLRELVAKWKDSHDPKDCYFCRNDASGRCIEYRMKRACAAKLEAALSPRGVQQ